MAALRERHPFKAEETRLEGETAPMSETVTLMKNLTLSADLKS